MNGIIYDGKVYVLENGIDERQCTHCQLKEICDENFREDSYPCAVFDVENKVYFRFSKSLTDMISKKY